MPMYMLKSLSLVPVMFLVLTTDLSAKNGGEVKPSLALGAAIFKEHCVLCHGNMGYGDGILPLSLKKYPSTNLHESRYGTDLPSLRTAIRYGGSQNYNNTFSGVMSNEMPPWGRELSYEQIESVAWFIQALRKEPKKAADFLKKIEINSIISIKKGKLLYKNYCSLCHGQNGEGNGELAKVMKDASPVNLQLSQVNDQYLKEIIVKGGAAIDRSPRMPPWGQQLTEAEIDSIILYIKTLRETP